MLCLQSGYDSRQTENYIRITSSQRLSGSNAGVAGRWAFQLNNISDYNALFLISSNINPSTCGTGHFPLDIFPRTFSPERFPSFKAGR